MKATDMLVGDILAGGRSRHPDKPAIVGERVSRTYGELTARVDRLAGALVEAGVRPRDRMAILAGNDPGVVEMCLAASMVGAVVVPLNPRSTGDDIAFQAADADARFAFVQGGLESLARTAGLLDHQSWFSGQGLETLIDSGQPYRGDRPSSDDVLIQLYTSGTTGRPKGCLLTHRGWLAAIGGWAHATGMSHRDVVWAQLPLFHVAGLHFLFTTLATGGTYVVDGPGDAGRFWEVVRARSVTVATLFPNAFDIVGHPDTSTSSHSIRLAFAQQTNDALLQALPHATVATSYGATELGGMALVAFGDECGRPGSVLGRPLVSMAVAVLDDNDHPVADGQVGELCFRGASTTPGYWKLPEASAEVSRNGWLHTGDLGREDPDGLVFFVDRKKDMVKAGGENVYSVEVELALLTHPAVVECAVIGVPDDRWGEAVKAVVVAREKVSAEDLDRWCLDRLAAFKRPRWYDFVAGLPRNATAKVVKPELRATHDPATSIRLPERS